jgi:hypothetical protein
MIEAVPSQRARQVLCVFALALLTVHGVVCYLSPLVGQDWTPGYQSLGDATDYALAQSRLLHAIATPLATLVLLVGVFVLAARRLPRADAWDDVLALIALSALIWIAAPHAGVLFFARPYAAAWIYGGAAAVWLLVPLRCGWRLPLWLAIAGGLVIGAGTRQYGTLALVLAIRERRHRALIAALAVGNVVLYALPPWVDFRGWKPGFELSLNALYLEVKEGGTLVSLVALLAFAKLVLGALRPRWAGEPAPVVRETLALGGLWLFASALALCGPGYSEVTLLPATLILCVGAYPYLGWLATSLPMRVVVVVVVIAIHAIAWTTSLATYVELDATFRTRMAAIAAAPPGGIATIPPYSEIDQTFWAYGEDWPRAGQRQLVAIERFGLRDIEFAPPFRKQEQNPHVAVRFEGDPLAQPQLWASEVDAARQQFAAALRAGATARLVADGITFPELRGRPLLIAFAEPGNVVVPAARRLSVNDDDDYPISVKPAFHQAYPETYAFAGAQPAAVRYEDRRYWVRPMTSERTVLIACDPARCILLDAFVPRL